MLWMTAFALAAPPQVEVAWTPRGATLTALPPPGHELATDALVHLQLGSERARHEVRASGAALAHGLGVGIAPGLPLEGRIELGICAKATGVCTAQEFALSAAVPDRRRGTVALTVEPWAHGPPGAFGPDATADAAEAAFAAARSNGTLVLLDFSAVWCPPCVVLAAEVLHADPPSEALEGYEVAVLDVDHASSFELKDRYQVGGYPTVIAVDAEGTEVARIVGYPGRVAFEDWLVDARAGDDARDLAADPSTIEPARAAELAWKMIRAHDAEAATPWLARAGDVDTIERHLAEASVEPTAARVQALAERAPERAAQWIGILFRLEPEDRATARAAAEVAVHHLRGSDLADALYAVAHFGESPEEQRLLYGAAASTLASTLDGSARDKGFVTFLADLHHLAGHTDQAATLLAQWSARFPDEPTFDLTAARIHLEAEQLEASLASASTALARSWGDNRLRAAAAKAEALAALGRASEARALAEQELAAFAPDSELDVRSHRYRARLEEFLSRE